MTVILGAPVAPDKLKAWRDPSKSEQVGPLEWSEAVRRYRLVEFDLLWRDPEGSWYGYKLKKEFSLHSKETRLLTDAQYSVTLQRSIA